MGTVIASIISRGRSVRAEGQISTGLVAVGPQLLAWTQQGWQARPHPLFALFSGLVLLQAFTSLLCNNLCLKSCSMLNASNKTYAVA